MFSSSWNWTDDPWPLILVATTATDRQEAGLKQVMSTRTQSLNFDRRTFWKRSTASKSLQVAATITAAAKEQATTSTTKAPTVATTTATEAVTEATTTTIIWATATIPSTSTKAMVSKTIATVEPTAAATTTTVTVAATISCFGSKSWKTCLLFDQEWLCCRFLIIWSVWNFNKTFQFETKKPLSENSKKLFRYYPTDWLASRTVSCK